MVLVTDNIPATDRKAATYLEKIVTNRREYADHHGYELAIRQLSSTPNEQISPKVRGWAKLKLLREVVEAYPDSEWFWFLDQDAVIMDPQISMTKDILANLDSQMLRDIPVVPPDSVIRTIKTATPDTVQFVLSQDYSGLNLHSFLLRNGDWTKYFLETWVEPMYRSYGFERHEISALEHIIQWHYTILSKTALLPRRLLASYNNAADDMAYKDTDFVVVLQGCRDEGRSCEMEFDRFWTLRSRTAEAMSQDAIAAQKLGATV
ncbi:Putative uncharacterized protein [Taphrina deformans PYCC 5710]|uniref:Alpha-1,2-galactosyltransferase gmh3 n=1 Tax=Taphrina deformans (strain PYCC 5710 / ATCC 11124 / CBS 356.35 / IMI 108563 / JCM 9778 / NBRC 8474) TaxID=1097556 RepID=R4XIC8_TAPDE|nr:Putative uncharacterized protein [Taphrina deformans PYCC 5710]|eukprot:CCG83112.1 Putative uncharacterized protein [Taphrina deformans PYCC 5710]